MWRLWGMAALLAVCSCATKHYRVTSVERSRILVDKRYDAVPSQAAQAFMAPYKQRIDSLMSPVVGQAASYLYATGPESPLSNLLPDVLMWGAQRYGERPDFAIYNIGGMRAAFAAGDVTVGDVLDVAPFENKICFVTLTGEQVLELFGQIASSYGEGVSRGIELVIEPDGRLRSARLNGKEFEKDAKYRIATIDYVAQGNDKMVAFKKATDVNSPQEESNNVRYLIMDYFREKAGRGEAVDARIEGRITVVANPDGETGGISRGN